MVSGILARSVWVLYFVAGIAAGAGLYSAYSDWRFGPYEVTPQAICGTSRTRCG